MSRGSRIARLARLRRLTVRLGRYTHLHTACDEDSSLPREILTSQAGKGRRGINIAIVVILIIIILIM